MTSAQGAPTETLVMLPVGSERVFGVLVEPREPSDIGVLILSAGVNHAGPGKDRLYVRLARRLAAEGLASLRIDYVGTGESSGGVRWPDAAHPDTADVEAAARLLHDRGYERLAIVGSCFGAVLHSYTASGPADSPALLCSPHRCEFRNGARSAIGHSGSSFAAPPDQRSGVTCCARSDAGHTVACSATSSGSAPTPFAASDAAIFGIPTGARSRPRRRPRDAAAPGAGPAHMGRHRQMADRRDGRTGRTSRTVRTDRFASRVARARRLRRRSAWSRDHIHADRGHRDMGRAPASGIRPAPVRSCTVERDVTRRDLACCPW